MSLINNMLNELDQRQAGALNKMDPAIADLEAIDSLSIEQKSSSSRFYILLTVLMFVLVCMLISIVYEDSVSNWLTQSLDGTSVYESLHNNRGAISLSSQQDIEDFSSRVNDSNVYQEELATAPLLSLALDQNITAMTNGIVDEISEEYEIEAASQGQEIQSIEYELINYQPTIIFRFNAEPAYRINILEKPARLLIDFTDLEQSLEQQHVLRNAPEFLRNQRTKFIDGVFSYVFEFEHRVNLLDTQYSKTQQGHELKIVFDVNTDNQHVITLENAKERSELESDVMPEFSEVNLQATDDYVVPEVIDRETIHKVVHRQDGVLTAEDWYQKAVQQYRQGEMDEARTQLLHALDENPQHVSARMLLTEIYLATQRNADATNVLIEGLEYDISHTAMAKLCAQLLQQQGNNALALMYLQAAMPKVNEDPEYIALTAALLQQEQRYAESIQYYQQLLNLNEQHGLWWMGLAISLQALGSDTQALEAFRNARRDAALTTEVRQFIQQRIANLQS